MLRLLPKILDPPLHCFGDFHILGALEGRKCVPTTSIERAKLPARGGCLAIEKRKASTFLSYMGIVDHRLTPPVFKQRNPCLLLSFAGWRTETMQLSLLATGHPDVSTPWDVLQQNNLVSRVCSDRFLDRDCRGRKESLP